jgi:aspartyl/asparaginyl beta-hydroxylase (cupin superfamily)
MEQENNFKKTDNGKNNNQEKKENPDQKNNKTKKKTCKIANQSYYKVSDFPQLKMFEANWKKIREELDGIIKEEENYRNSIKNGNLDEKDLKDSEKYSLFFEPWIEHDLYEESRADGWDVAPLLIGGNYIEKKCRRAPFLFEIIKSIPELASASYSLLKPGTHIVPHKGYDEYSEEILRYHLGMIIPKGDLGIRVNSEIKIWKEGEAFIFDDFQIHEAWNLTNEYRYVLICDFDSKIPTDIEDNEKSNVTSDNTTTTTQEENQYDSNGNIKNKNMYFNDKKFNSSINNYIT